MYQKIIKYHTKIMKAFYFLTVLLLFSLNLTTCSKSNFIRRLESDDPSDTDNDGNSTIPIIQEEVVVDYQPEVFVQ